MEQRTTVEQRQKLQENHVWAKSELKRCVDYWLKNGMDSDNGGIYTCTNRDGSLYSKDKGVWMQGRSAWAFSRLCSLYGTRTEWLEAAKSCIEFMEKSCFDQRTGRLYLMLLENGKTVSQEGQCFSEAFYVIGNAEYAAVANDTAALERARKGYQLIWQLNHGLIADPNHSGVKTMLDGKPGRAHADPMIYLNISSILRRCDPENAALYEERSAICAEEILQYHFKPQLHCTLEKVLWDGSVCDAVQEGRIVNPGHDIECSWFLMEEANRQNNSELHKQAEQIFRYAVESGWDTENGGLFSFLDYQDNSIPEVFLGNRKTWWPHCEALIAALMLYRDTDKEEYLQWFFTFADYCRRTFCDSEYGEWYSKLMMDGTVDDNHRKGNTFKGLFHVPRMLMKVERMLAELCKE